MQRQLRLEYPGAIYHVMRRGNRRQDIFLDDVDRHDFLKTLAEDPDKGQLAQRLRRETTLSVRQIAERLHLGTPRSASFRPLRKRKQGSSSPSSQFHLYV
jgi:hypothetical protein